MRPGRIDRRIGYSYATQSQATALYKGFFPESRFGDIKLDSNVTALLSQPFQPTAPPTPPSESVKKLPPIHDEDAPLTVTVETQTPLQHLSRLFGSRIPPNEFTTAELQGYLLSCKSEPLGAVHSIEQWVNDERDERKRKKEREEER
jgi:mitochondrial chaperone BCS1